MAKYRGSKGSVTLAGGTVANLQSWELDIARPALEGTVMGDTGKKTGLDIPGATGRLTALFDAADPAQEDILDILLTDTDVVTLAGVFLVATGKSFSMSIVPTSAAISQQRGAYVSVSFSFESDGTITKAWV